MEDIKKYLPFCTPSTDPKTLLARVRSVDGASSAVVVRLVSAVILNGFKEFVSEYRKSASASMEDYLRVWWGAQQFDPCDILRTVHEIPLGYYKLPRDPVKDAVNIATASPYINPALWQYFQKGQHPEDLPIAGLFHEGSELRSFTSAQAVTQYVIGALLSPEVPHIPIKAEISPF